MVVISNNNNRNLTQKIAEFVGAKFMLASTKIFAGRELQVCLDSVIHDKKVVIVSSVSYPVNDNLIELLLLCDAARQTVAKRITALIPYLAYARQDHTGVKFIAKLLEAAGVDEIIALDLHSQLAVDLFNIKVQNLDAISLFAPFFKRQRDIIIVSLDAGSISRA